MSLPIRAQRLNRRLITEIAFSTHFDRFDRSVAARIRPIPRDAPSRYSKTCREQQSRPEQNSTNKLTHALAPAKPSPCRGKASTPRRVGKCSEADLTEFPGGPSLPSPQGDRRTRQMIGQITAKRDRDCRLKRARLCTPLCRRFIAIHRCLVWLRDCAPHYRRRGPGPRLLRW